MTPEELDRRAFLRRIGATAGGLAGIAAGAAILGGCDGQLASSHPPPPTALPKKQKRHNSTDAVTTDALGLPVAEWVVEENARPGTADWLVHGTPPLGVEGFADRSSAVAGDEVTVYVTSTARVVGPKIYRLGWYQGYGARLVADLGDYPGVQQPAATFLPDTRTVECHWRPTFRFTVGDDWPTGYYLIRLGTSSGYGQWLPLVVRDDSSKASVVIQSSMTTWQAYSLWGDYSLYLGPTTGGGDSVDNRAYMVSFDRPYAPGWEDGSADLFGNEYPMVALCERLGLDVTYWTDVDLHERPELLTNHRLLVSLGHDEYWSSTMRFACQDALAKGVNFAFFGANACYRHIRFESSPLGENRRVVCYKDASLDPLLGNDDAEVTANWDSGPMPRPESQLIGIEYVAYQPIGTPFEDLVVADPDYWIMEGTGLKEGDKIADANGSEFDRYSPGAPSPANVHIVCHSPITSVLGPSYSDMSYYSVPNGGGVFASGTASFVTRLWANNGHLPQPFAPAPVAGTTEPLTKITTNVLAAMTKGPGSKYYPSEENWTRFYSAGSSAPSSVDVP